MEEEEERHGSRVNSTDCRLAGVDGIRQIMKEGGMNE